MTKTQIQQVLVVLLLILFGIVWTMTRQPSAPPRGLAPTTSAPPAGDTNKFVSPEAKPAAQAVELPPAVPTRNPFRLPQNLARSLAERQRALQEALDQQKKQARAAPPSPAPGAAKPKLENLKLQGVFWGTSNPQAIINRKTLSVGDEIEGARVVSIGKGGVTLSVSGREVLLEPPQPGQTREGTAEPDRGRRTMQDRPLW